MSTPRRPECFYLPRKGFFTRNSDGEWVVTDKETVRMKMIRAGFSDYVPRDMSGKILSKADHALLDTVEKKCIHYAGPLAGWTTGLQKIGRLKVLVTRVASPIEPARGKFPLIQEIIEAQFGEHADYFLTWCKGAWLRVRRGGGPMLPALICAGGADMGKSLMQNHVIAPLLGGRQCTPFRYWTGETNFNEDICGSELLMMEDVIYVKAEKRRMFGDALKSAIANETTSLHPKGDKAETVRCVWAISISSNLEPQNLRTLPLLDGSLEDKLLILGLKAKAKCLPAAQSEAHEGFTAKLREELPSLAGFLHRYEPPERCRGERSYVKAFRDPAVMELVSDDDVVPKLLWLIDDLGLLSVELDGAKGSVTRNFTSMELERALLAADRNRQAARLLEHTSLGYLLREAARRFPGRVAKAGEAHAGQTKWKITPPVKLEP